MSQSYHNIISSIPHLTKKSPSLSSMPQNPKGLILIIEIEHGTDKLKGIDGHRYDTIYIANALIAIGYEVILLFYRDSQYVLLNEVLRTNQTSAILPRVNPGVEKEFTQDLFMRFLDKLVEAGHLVMPHPKCMNIMGVKESQFKIRNSRFGIPDTKIYRNPLEWNTQFLQDWNLNNTHERVIKPNKGSQGEGVWIVKNIHSYPTLLEDSQIRIQEARDNHIQQVSIKQFNEMCMEYFKPEDGLIINQPFLPRITEGEIRLVLLNSNVISIIKKVPIEGGISAAIQSGAVYTEYSPDCKDYLELVKGFKQELPQIKKLLKMKELPLIWSADFIQDQPNKDGHINYRIGEFNCTCVGIKSIVESIAPLIAKHIDTFIDNNKKNTNDLKQI